MQTENFVLIEKLDAFIRKYYKNQLIRGGLWVTAGIVTAFLLASILEYYGHFNTSVRTALFIVLSVFSLVIIGRLIVVPLLKLYALGKRLDYHQAAAIIGQHFPDVQDKLLNTLQLKAEAGDNALLQAAIDQKTSDLKPVPFQKAIDFGANRKYIKYAAIPLFIFIVLAAVNRGFTDSTKRLVQYNTHFEKEAPFRFLLDMEDLSVVQNSAVRIEMHTEGDVAPNEVYINLKGHSFKMRKEGNNRFAYTIKKATESQAFNFLAEGFSSKEYRLETIAKPSLLDYELAVTYPAYTGMQNETVKNTSELTVPAGTNIKWKLGTRNTTVTEVVDDKVERIKSDGRNKLYTFTRQILKPRKLLVRTSNEDIAQGDSLEFSLQVIPDLYPEIKLEEQGDSSTKKLIYLLGRINDDYGFKKLVFHYQYIESADKVKKGKTGAQVIAIPKNGKSHRFFHMWDLNQLDIQPEDKLEYYFEVWDNDAVFGSKRTRSTPQIFAAPSLDEINKKVEENTEKIKEDLSDSKKEINSLEKEISELEQKLTEKKDLTWEDKKKINELLDKHKDLEQQIEQVVEQQQQNNADEQEFKKIDQDIKEKQEQIEELFEEVISDEMKELMRQIEELMKKNQKPQLMEQLEQLKMNDQDVKKQLDRMLEQLKQLQLEKKVNETVEKLNQLSKEQDDLAKEGDKDDKKSEELLKKQKELSKKFDDLKKDLKDIDKKNQDLEKPLDMDTKNMDSEKKSVDEQQEQSEQKLGKNQKSKAKQNQKKAADEMKKMAQDLKQQMEKAMQQQHMEDYNTLREILDNLIQVSKDQEALMNNFKEVRTYNPKFVELGQHQKKLRDDAKMIEDSLFALSKRVKQVEHFINKEIGLVNHHIGKAMYEIGERRNHMIINHQQYVMTSMNNLALMLEQSLEQMQQQMQSKPSSGSCNNPGNNKKPNGAKSLREMQEGLKKQLEQMGKDQKKGSKPSSKQFAESAAQQAAIRKKLKDLQRQLEKEGNGKKLGNLGKTQEMMDQLEKDLYNKRLNSDVLKRQQEILTRLLEHEKAERKQEQDNKRKSNEGEDLNRSVPPSIEEYLKQKNKEQELLKTLPPDLAPYYKDKVRSYFEQIGN